MLMQLRALTIQANNLRESTEQRLPGQLNQRDSVTPLRLKALYWMGACAVPRPARARNIEIVARTMIKPSKPPGLRRRRFRCIGLEVTEAYLWEWKWTGIVPSIRCPVPFQKAGNALLTPLRLLVTMGDGDYLLPDGSLLLLPLDYAIYKSIQGQNRDQILNIPL
ncbi:hypothetical protein EVAR_57238_1 [Eumeta japonica]|uniref:Uncharacterized protein n=1 Tax=Eumeta variegata TaxID=151549 RepID=A0A4C1ZKS8_EUMVA|nr:hypothetical protein EVAR_57238_1 [Eumeta japonica]